MATITISTRKTASGKRYVVRYRLGGRMYPIVRAGTFKTEREAKARRDLVAGEIAHGRNPADLLVTLTTVQAPAISFVSWGDRFLESRIDVDPNTIKNYRSATRKIGEELGSRAPATITATEIAEWIAALAETRKAGTLQQYLIAFRLVLDHAQVDPNPARDPRVRLPKQVRDEPVPPPAEHVLAILGAMSERYRLLFIVIEQGALRLGEAVGLRWGDVDVEGLRLRLSRSQTKRDRARWVYLPEWLMQVIEETCPLEDRVPDRRVFQGLTEAAAYQAMPEPAETRRSPTTTRTIYGIAGSLSGTSQEYLRGSSRSVPGTRGRP